MCQQINICTVIEIFSTVAISGPKGPNSFDLVFTLQNGVGGNSGMTWGFIYLLSLSSSAFVTKWDMWRLQGFLGLLNIVDHDTKIWG